MNQFKYLGSLITEEGRCEKDIRKMAMMKKALLTRKMDLELRE